MFSLSSEFPNDNPELHGGVSWVCLSLTGPATPELSLHVPVPVPVPESLAEEIIEAQIAPEPPPPRHSEVVAAGSYQEDLDLDEETQIVVEDLPPLDETATLEGIPEELATTLPPACDDPFTTLLTSLVDIAIGAGSPYVASVLPALLLEGRLEHAMPDDVAQALSAAGIAQDGVMTPSYVARANAWRAILSGTSDDFDACGAAMLDEWAAELLACLLGAPSRAVALKRDLRARGIAAFGLVDAA